MSSKSAAAIATASQKYYAKLIKKSPELRRRAELVRQDVFGHRPQLNVKSGNKIAKKGFTGPYIARYYPESINVSARKVSRRAVEASKHETRSCCEGVEIPFVLILLCLLQHLPLCLRIV